MTSPRNPRKPAARKKTPTAAERPVSATASLSGVEVDAPTPLSQWKQKRGVLLTLPSGFTIRATNPGLRAFLKAGVVPNALMGIIQEALDKRAQPDVSKIMPEGKVDLDMAREMYKLYDSVACEVFVEPRCWPVPVNGINSDGTPEDRENFLYVDEVADEDKQFIFGWVSGGTSDVATFREQLREHMDAVSRGEGVGVSPVGTPGNRAERRAR